MKYHIVQIFYIFRRVTSMKKYEKPIVLEEQLELVDIIAVSSDPDGINADSISANDLWR